MKGWKRQDHSVSPLEKDWRANQPTVFVSPDRTSGSIARRISHTPMQRSHADVAGATNLRIRGLNARVLASVLTPRAFAGHYRTVWLDSAFRPVTTSCEQVCRGKEQCSLWNRPQDRTREGRFETILWKVPRHDEYIVKATAQQGDDSKEGIRDEYGYQNCADIFGEQNLADSIYI
jgi:hypothetical protein